MTVGITLVLLGIGLPLGFLAWQSAQDSRDALKQQQAADSIKLEDPTVDASPATSTSAEDSSKPAALAKLSVPRFGNEWTRVVYEGTSVSRVLTPLGVGHYKNSAQPGQTGNFALAAHRAGSGGPFRKIDELVEGDLAYVETATERFTYRFIQSKVVDPADVDVISSNPTELTVTGHSDALMTLTSCTPVHVNTQRYVVWFELIATEKI